MEKLANGKARCLLCSRELAQGGGSTGGLRNHLNAVHPDYQPNVKATTQPSLGSFGVGPQRSCSDSRQEKITTLLTKVIIGNMLPLSLVDNQYFHEFMSYLEPNYKVPCRQTLTARLDNMKEKIAERVADELKAASAIAMTTDIWTSISNDAYISVTASFIAPQWQLRTLSLANKPMEERHTQANISARLLETATAWDIQSKITAVVHDGAANMKETGAINKWTDVSCAAHKLHLCVTGAMGIDKVTNTIISKCVSAASRLVGHFSHSAMASAELEKRQLAMSILGENGQPLKLIQHVRTRWNSVFDMFERLTKLRWPVTAVLSDRNVVKASDAKTMDMKEEYWQIIEDLLPVLQPIKVVTALLSAENTTSSSLVYPMAQKLVTMDLAVSDNTSERDGVQAFKAELRRAITDRFQLNDVATAEHPFVTATVLDPATKGMELFSVEFREAAYGKVRTMTLQSAACSSIADDPISDDVNEPPTKQPKLDTRAAGLKFLSAARATPGPTLHEFDRYLNAAVQEDVDALQWWASNASLYPATAAVAQRYLSVPASSVQSERQFSAAGRLINKLRTRLDPDRVDTMIFLYENI